MHVSAHFPSSPDSVVFFWSRNKVYHKHEVRVLLYLLGQLSHDNITLIHWITINHVLLYMIMITSCGTVLWYSDGLQNLRSYFNPKWNLFYVYLAALKDIDWWVVFILFFLIINRSGYDSECMKGVYIHVHPAYDNTGYFCHEIVSRSALIHNYNIRK